ncbi:MAG: Uma2 family endonuclease [Planctomycetes bacterium]|nr:Uma2 family endonuclease [Planctomycetota bacterium]
MATTTVQRPRLHLRPDSAGIRLTPREFDQADFKVGWRYELINGVLVVSPTPLEMERDPNEQLGYWLRLYHETHPQGKCLDKTLPEHTVRTGKNRRRADRVIWIGLGRLPTKKDVPSVVGEFVSAGRRDRERDYIDKRDEYLAIGVDEYWVFDRFQRTLSVFFRRGARIGKRVLAECDVYTTPLLPGFELPLRTLFALVDDWQADEE